MDLKRLVDSSWLSCPAFCNSLPAKVNPITSDPVEENRVNLIGTKNWIDMILGYILEGYLSKGLYVTTWLQF